LYMVCVGQRSCGCFGVVPVNPWVPLTLDVAILAVLAVCRPPGACASARRARDVSPRRPPTAGPQHAAAGAVHPAARPVRATARSLHTAANAGTRSQRDFSRPFTRRYRGGHVVQSRQLRLGMAKPGVCVGPAPHRVVHCGIMPIKSDFTLRDLL